MVYSLILDPDLSLGGTPEIEILDEATHKLELVDPTPDGGINLNKPMQNGRALKPDHMPTKVRRLDDRPIPDYRTWHYFYSVSDRFKEVVEKIEPGVHQFFPAEYVDRKGNHVANMWFLNVVNRIDSVDRGLTEPTGMILAYGLMWMPAYDVPGADRSTLKARFPKPKMYFSRKQIGDRHLWFDKHSIYGPYISDELADALASASLTGVKVERKESV